MKNNIIVIQQINTDFLQKWQELWDISAFSHFYNSPQWFLAFLEGYDIDTYHIVAIEKNGQLDAVLPLITMKQFGIKMLCCPGGKFLDKSSLLLRDNRPTLFKLLIKQLKKMGNFYLHELSSELTERIMAADSNLIKQPSSIDYYLPIKPDPFQFVANSQKNKIANKIKAHGEHLSYQYFTDPAGLNIAWNIEQNSIKKQKNKTAFNTMQDKAFFVQLLQKNPRNVIVDVVFYDNKPIVHSIGFTYKNIFQGVHMAYDGDYRFLSPGKVLLNFIFQRLQKEDIEICDFSRGESVIKKEFTRLSYQQYDIFYTKHSMHKCWLLLGNKTRNAILRNKLLYENYLQVKKLLSSIR